MRLDSLPLEDRFVEHFATRGIEELYPPQAAAVDAGIAEGESVVAAIPTASGKTLLAQLAMLTADGPALFVVPLRALATEKYETFDALPGVSVGISTGEYDATDEGLARHDIVVATSEKVDSALRHGADWVRELACVVVDEVHVIDEPSRGPTLEVTITNLRRRNADLQLVALSATVANPDELAGWLDATLVESTWRPVALRTGVYADDRIVLDDGTERSLPTEGDPVGTLVAETAAEGGQSLVFVRSRGEAQRAARSLADRGLRDASEVAEAIRGTAGTGTGRELAAVVADGVAFHHAGLRASHRAAVERAFRDRELAAICATPTLAAGVNVPARRVVVRDHERYTGSGFEPLPVLEVQQMFGRAGRPGLDPHGEALLIADRGEREELTDRYIGAEPEAVRSRLDEPRAVRTHVLANVASGVADSRPSLLDVLADTFYAYTDREPALATLVEEAIVGLDAAGMVRTNGGLAATELGALVSRVYVDPTTGSRVVTGLDRAAGMDRVTALTVLELVCDTPDMPTGYLRSAEEARVVSAAMGRAEELTKPVRAFEGDFRAWLPAFETATILEAYADGADLDELADRHGIGPGDVRRYAERAEWLLAATASLAEHVDSDAVGRIREVREALLAREATPDS